MPAYDMGAGRLGRGFGHVLAPLRPAVVQRPRAVVGLAGRVDPDQAGAAARRRIWSLRGDARGRSGLLLGLRGVGRSLGAGPPCVAEGVAPRTGGDAGPDARVRHLRVLIHVPAQETTGGHGAQMASRRGFDSRPRTGGDINSVMTSFLSTCFDPCPRMGGDDGGCGCAARGRGFDPHPRTGGDWGCSARPVPAPCFDPRPRTGGDRRSTLGNPSA